MIASTSNGDGSDHGSPMELASQVEQPDHGSSSDQATEPLDFRQLADRALLWAFALFGAVVIGGYLGGKIGEAFSRSSP